MHTDAIKSAYRRYAGFYDALFGPALHRGRKAIVDALGCQSGDRILEVGVGTGLSLPLYPGYVRVTGIDISADMLQKARQRVTRRNLSQVEALLEMDAEAMTFPDASFDTVVAMYVVSVSPCPARLLEEIRRVCRPGGSIFIVNHFRSENRFLGRMEKALAGYSAQLGFHPDFELGDLLDDSPLELTQVSRVGLLWKVLRLRNGSSADALQTGPGVGRSRLADTASATNQP